MFIVYSRVFFLVLPLIMVAKEEWDKVKTQIKPPTLDLTEAWLVSDEEKKDLS
jgi:hypothetical protein